MLTVLTSQRSATAQSLVLNFHRGQLEMVQSGLHIAVMSSGDDNAKLRMHSAECLLRTLHSGEGT